jgi:hypothetical protein
MPSNDTGVVTGDGAEETEEAEGTTEEERTDADAPAIGVVDPGVPTPVDDTGLIADSGREDAPPVPATGDAGVAAATTEPEAPADAQPALDWTIEPALQGDDAPAVREPAVPAASEAIPPAAVDAGSLSGTSARLEAVEAASASAPQPAVGAVPSVDDARPAPAALVLPVAAQAARPTEAAAAQPTPARPAQPAFRVAPKARPVTDWVIADANEDRGAVESVTPASRVDVQYDLLDEDSEDALAQDWTVVKTKPRRR